MEEYHPLEQVVKLLKAENANYKQNFDKIKRAYEEQQGTVETLTTKVQLLQNERDGMNDDHKRLVTEWKTKLSKQTKEFDEIRRKLVPLKDVETIKAEAYAQYLDTVKSKEDLHEADVSKWRDLYYTIQKDFEIFKLGLQDKEAFYQAALEDMAATYQQEIIQLHLKISEKNEALEDTLSIGARLRELQRDNNELRLKVKSLTVDLENTQTQLTDDRTNHQLSLQNVKRQITEKESEVNNLKAEKDAARKKISQVDEEMRKAMVYQDELHGENTRLRAEVNGWNTRHEQVVHQFKIEKSDANFAFMKQKTELEQKLTYLDGLLRDKDATLEGMKQEMSDLSNQKLQLEKKHQQDINAVKESSANNERILKEKLLDMEKEMTLMRSQKDSELKELKHQLDILKQSKEAAEATISSLRLQLQNLSSAKEELEAEYHVIKDKIESMNGRLVSSEELASKLQLEINDLRRKEQDFLIKCSNLEDQNIRLHKEILDASDEHQRREKKLSGSIGDLEQLVQAKDKKISDLEDNLQLKDQNSQTQISSVVDTMKKLKHGYKQKVEDLEGRLEELKDENEALRKSLENENHESQLRLKEMFRRQQEFAHFLRSEGLLKNSSNHNNK